MSINAGTAGSKQNASNEKKTRTKTPFHPRPDVIEKKLLRFVKDAEDTHKISLRLGSTPITVPVTATAKCSIDHHGHGVRGDGEGDSVKLSSSTSKDNGCVGFGLREHEAKMEMIDDKYKSWITKPGSMSSVEMNKKKNHLALAYPSKPKPSTDQLESCTKPLFPNLPESIIEDGEESDDYVYDDDYCTTYNAYKSRLRRKSKIDLPKVPEIDFTEYSSDRRFLDLINTLTPCFKAKGARNTKVTNRFLRKYK